jgi:hypothetical protein
MFRITLAALVVVFTACDGLPDADPLAPDDVLEARKNAAASVTGAAHTTFRGAWRTLTFSARADGDDVHGQLHLHNRFLNAAGEETVYSATVTCIAVRDGQAWIGAVIEGADRNPYVRFRAVDNGEGAKATDQISWIWRTARPGGDLHFCQTMPEWPLVDIEAGNIQIRGETSSVPGPFPAL